MILFKCRADSKVGWGHLLRCVSVAEELKSQNKKSLLYCFGGKKILKKIGSNPFEKCFDKKEYNNISNISKFLKFLKKEKIKKLVIDDPKINSKIRSKIRSFGYKIIQLNYDFDNLKNIDIAINHLFRNENISKYSKIFKGPKYLIIRKRVINKITNFDYYSKKKLLFTFGASINYRIIKIITLLLKSYELKNYDINVILPNKKLKKYFIFKRKKKFKLFINPSIITIKKLYKSSKVAVCAGGIQLSELIINKVIPIALSKNFKEEKNISFFLKLHLCHKLNLNKSLFSLKKNLIRKIQVIYTNQKIAKYRYHLLDDLGALRTSKIILSNN